MSEIAYASASMCDNCKRVVRHTHRWHGCRLRWIKRRVERARMEGWDEGYKFAVDHIEEPMVYADVAEYGTALGDDPSPAGITIDEEGQRDG